MWHFLETIFSPKQYMPHGSCYLWQTPLIGLHVVSDLLIAIAYFSIPTMLIYFVCQRRDVPFNKVFIWFGLFIISCGVGHLLDIWTLWHPAYWLSGVERAFTAFISCYTALELMVLLPKFLSLKTPEELAVVEAANRSKSLFLAHMSHELRTPLNAILGFTELMSRDANLAVKHRKYIDIVSRSGEHLLGLINDILEMSKIEAGKTEVWENDLDLHDLIRSLEEMLRLKAQSKGLKLVIEQSPEVPRHIRTDESKLRQVLINLVNNAIKFTKKGSVTLRIKSARFEQQNRLIFEVEDTGPGIAPEEQSKLFEAFSQSETGKKSGQGTGLGLPISQKFVELMGGELTVSSRLGEGTLFAFYIPAETFAHNSAETISTSEIIGLARNQPNYRILVADDDSKNCFLLTQLLSSIGFEVREVYNGQEAVETCFNWQPDLIFMDMKMPVMDGYTATQKIKKCGEDEAPAIVALTAQAFEEDRQNILAIGCDDFIRKPFQQQDILAVIRQHLNVQYCYREDGLSARDDSIEDSDSFQSNCTIGTEDLEVMPREWIQQLSERSAQCSDLLVLKLIEEIPREHANLAAALTQIVDEFRYDQIFELTQSIINEPVSSQNKSQPQKQYQKKC